MPEVIVVSPSKLAALRAELRELAAFRKGPHMGELFKLQSEALEEIHAELAALGSKAYRDDQKLEADAKAAVAASGNG